MLVGKSNPGNIERMGHLDAASLSRSDDATPFCGRGWQDMNVFTSQAYWTLLGDKGNWGRNIHLSAHNIEMLRTVIYCLDIRTIAYTTTRASTIRVLDKVIRTCSTLSAIDPSSVKGHLVHWIGTSTSQTCESCRRTRSTGAIGTFSSIQQVDWMLTRPWIKNQTLVLWNSNHQYLRPTSLRAHV